MNPYIKNFGIGLVGGHFFIYLLTFIGMYDSPMFPVLGFFGVIIGTIVGAVLTHKELNGNIQFGKAVGPVILILAALAVWTIIRAIFTYGMDFIDYFILDYSVVLFLKVIFALSILLAIGTWYMFEKAGHEGWKSIIPIYNIVIMCEIGRVPTWYVGMMFVPIANIIFLIKILSGISTNFGKDDGFTAGLFFLRSIFMAVLGYGDATYQGPKVASVNNDIIDDL